METKQDLKQREKRGPWRKSTLQEVRRRNEPAHEAGTPDADTDEAAPHALPRPILGITSPRRHPSPPRSTRYAIAATFHHCCRRVSNN